MEDEDLLSSTVHVHVHVHVKNEPSDCLLFAVIITKLFKGGDLHSHHYRMIYTLFTETGATQTMKTNQMAELKQ